MFDEYLGEAAGVGMEEEVVVVEVEAGVECQSGESWVTRNGSTTLTSRIYERFLIRAHFENSKESPCSRRYSSLV